MQDFQISNSSPYLKLPKNALVLSFERFEKLYIDMNPKKSEIIDGLTIKYHANGKTVWSKGKIVDGQADGYWEWYRIDGTIKRSGYFENCEPVGEWITYDKDGKPYKVTKR